MSVYLSQAALRRWTDREGLAEGQACYRRGSVTDLDLNSDMVRATVTVGGRPVRTRFRILSDGSVESHCPCLFTQERGMICVHVVAVGCLVADITEDPARERRQRIAARRQVEQREGRSPRALQRRRPGSAGSTPGVLRLRLDTDLDKGWDADAMVVTCQASVGDSRRRLDKIATDIPLSFTEQEADLLYVLEDLAGSEATPGILTLDRERFLDLLHAMAPGELVLVSGASALQVSDQPQLPLLAVTLETDSGELRVRHRLDAGPAVTLAGRRQAWVRIGSTLHPLEAVLPAALHGAYGTAGAVIPRAQVLAFLREELPKLEQTFLVDASVTEATFTRRVGEPDFAVELTGTPDLLQVQLWACYGEARVRAGVPSAAGGDSFPVAGEPLVFEMRAPAAEEEAAAWLQEQGGLVREGAGFKAVCGAEAVLGVLAGTVPALRARGWRVEFGGLMESLAGGAVWIRPTLTIAPSSSPGWFEVEITYADDQGHALDPALVEDALDAGRTSVNADGRLLLANRAALGMLRRVCGECLEASDARRARISDVHAGYLAGVLATQPGITVAADAAWREHARRQTERVGLEPVDVGEALGPMLRPYQQDGVNWLRFLEKGGYNGILADEMGLGKTIQALAWLQVERHSASARDLPALVVCPTSLVENWAREAARFVPHLTVHVVQGPDRHRAWAAVGTHQLVITSYALLRRDIERYGGQTFAVVVLDEAQHIKNRSTQNAQAAKQLQAIHRLVLTGTPMENSVSDLWSIMDFLMPQYLGSPMGFRESFERPVGAGGAVAEVALHRLRCKLRPFMLRRLKADVAKDLPEKISRVATCTMGPEQAALYRRLVKQYQDSLAALVEEKGFQQARFTVLKTLLRLRQLCCHPALLKADAEGTPPPSAKLELFFELLDEALDGGQRVLVFSQFVEMLHLLRNELDARGIRYAYLDGATRERQAEVDRFNTSGDIPLFLISLKAGGTGLNLTGANVVIHYDPWWNPAVEDQATDRAHRIGQTRNVYSIKLVTSDSIEEKVLELQARKRQLIDATVGGPNAMLRSLTWEDVQALLKL
ncbi:MAG: DEAD/DEAH box helicase [Lentisphaerae bacterium]|nr:DEAD/DEAH box helicase [Lentisphaerota bacterium]